MTNATRFRAEVTGRFVQFFSRDPKLKTVRWNAKWKAWYCSHGDALKAKAHYEATGRFLWPSDMRKKEPVKPAAKSMRRRAESQAEQRV